MILCHLSPIPIPTPSLTNRGLMPGRTGVEAIAGPTKRPVRCRRRGLLEIAPLRRRRRGVVGRGVWPTEDVKREVAEEEGAEDQGRGEEHGFVADGLDEGVEDLGEGVGRDAGAGDAGRVAVHAAAPGLADGLQRRHARRAVAFVEGEVVGARRHLGHDVRHGLVRFLVHVALYRGPEGVEEVDDAGEEEHVEGELGAGLQTAVHDCVVDCSYEVRWASVGVVCPRYFASSWAVELSGVASLSMFCSGDFGVSPADESSKSFCIFRGVLNMALSGIGGNKAGRARATIHSQAGKQDLRVPRYCSSVILRRPTLSLSLLCNCRCNSIAKHGREIHECYHIPTVGSQDRRKACFAVGIPKLSMAAAAQSRLGFSAFVQVCNNCSAM
ncbi:hypothetical protein KC335_g93 [Hortaea werneckii]|nr:hypothetical protein KC335_g93 [Hortaea werneckii]